MNHIESQAIARQGPSELSSLILKRGEDRRLRAGHAWVFSNEIETTKTSLDSFVPGQVVAILAHNGYQLGVGYVNPNTLISARLFSRDPRARLDTAFLENRLRTALQLRERLYPEPFYRLVYGESDGLPGMVIDRFDDVCVVQITTAGIERVKASLLDALASVVKPRTVVLRNDTAIRALEGLDAYVEVPLGTQPDTISIPESGCTFDAPLLSGQKTGWYFDQRDNRARMQRYVKDARVLDVFSYVGAWSIAAAAAGAKSVTSIETSETALEYLSNNARRNGVEQRMNPLRGDAFETLRRLQSTGERFDVVILDPPAFIRRKKDVKEGVLAYQRLNQLALHVLAPNGILLSASCSYHLHADVFFDVLRRSALRSERDLQVLEQGHQAPDHPIHPAIPETHYLKAYIARALPRF
jgi:23S rRNA (cytosine1962-C5)-methyltransferase